MTRHHMTKADFELFIRELQALCVKYAETQRFAFIGIIASRELPISNMVAIDLDGEESRLVCSSMLLATAEGLANAPDEIFYPFRSQGKPN